MAEDVGTALARIRELAGTIVGAPDLPQAVRDAAKEIATLASSTTDLAGESSDTPQTEGQSI